MKTPIELFGVETGKGWDKIISPLLEYCQANNIDVFQVKEKFGGLRFYPETYTDELDKMIREAEKLCDKTCEICGEPGVLRTTRWYKVLCDAHAKEHGYV